MSLFVENGIHGADGADGAQIKSSLLFADMQFGGDGIPEEASP